MKSTLITAAAMAVGASAAAIEQRASNLTAITVKGNAFFQGDDRFYIRGVDYQPGGSSDVADPLANTENCKRDIPYFQKLGLNAIRVYTIDNTADHEECMTELANAGIYLILDVNTPKYSLNREEPEASYNAVYLQSIFATIDKFANYDNTLAFFSGNEVINDGPTSAAAPYVKAVTRDMRQYIGSRGYRQIPVGYSAADINTNRLEMAEYMNCGSDDERSDFFAFNDYSWCDPSSYTISGWDQKVKNFTGYGIPLFLSEYGCNTNTREFQEVKALYSTEMTGVYSGGLVYEYSEESSNYGLVEIDGDSVSELEDFTALQSAFSDTSNPTGNGGYNSTGGASGCPAYSEPDWLVEDDALPAIPEKAKTYMTEGAGTGPGLSGSGSQNAGSTSTGTATPGSGSVTATASTSGSTTSSSSGSSSSGSSSGAVNLTPETAFTGLVFMVVSMATLFGAALL
ncbi:putativebeta-glucanosyltransferase gel1 [Phaeomoniella chlamydospora]|uniref:1,3-beta-glucanosyltransferase n=1 Tax=Phaeomoniella chlamydospora TaxID=158046 RepID=A0A0G2GNV7_PHACM|nr:putativebeta-glucanosyltransferase gel1 [Phaeomoniella chlamydospora]